MLGMQDVGKGEFIQMVAEFSKMPDGRWQMAVRLIVLLSGCLLTVNGHWTQGIIAIILTIH
jgi:hypothetical protein